MPDGTGHGLSPCLPSLMPRIGAVVGARGLPEQVSTGGRVASSRSPGSHCGCQGPLTTPPWEHVSSPGPEGEIHLPEVTQ